MPQTKKVFEHNLEILKRQKVTAIAATILSMLLFSFIYGIFKIPILEFGVEKAMHVSIFDVFYIILVSTMSGALFALMKHRSEGVAKGAGIGSFAAGTFGAVCSSCQSLTLVALGSTLFALPLESIVPFLEIIRFASIALLGFSLYTISVNNYSGTCSVQLPKSLKRQKNPDEAIAFLQSKNGLAVMAILIALLLVNQGLALTAFATAPSSYANVELGDLQYGSKLTLKAAPLVEGEQPAVSGYLTKVKSFPTVSELQQMPLTGNVVKDLLNNVVPRGTPWYGKDAGISFDDPASALSVLDKYRGLALDEQSNERWSRIVLSFTCDFCCGSPQQPTIIAYCGCAHSRAAQGLSKWLLKYYGDKYSDIEIYGEMGRWYAAWYPGTTIKRVVQELNGG